MATYFSEYNGAHLTTSLVEIVPGDNPVDINDNYGDDHDDDDDEELVDVNNDDDDDNDELVDVNNDDDDIDVNDDDGNDNANPVDVNDDDRVVVVIADVELLQTINPVEFCVDATFKVCSKISKLLQLFTIMALVGDTVSNFFNVLHL